MDPNQKSELEELSWPSEQPTVPALEQPALLETKLEDQTNSQSAPTIGPTLEQTVEQTTATNIASRTRDVTEQTVPENTEEILPVEQYVTRFRIRYHTDKKFRQDVHKHLKIRPLEKFKLGFGRKTNSPWYQRRTEAIIANYANITRTALYDALAARKDLEELKRAEALLADKNHLLTRTTVEHQTAHQAYEAITTQRQAEEERLTSELQQAREREQEKAQQQVAAVQLQYDPEALVREKLKAHLTELEGIKKTPAGQFKFDDERMILKLGDLFLKESIEGIEKDCGQGFLAKIRSEYNGVISHWSEIEDFSELSDIDWTQSMLLSMSKGYLTPRYPYLVTAKKGPGKKIGKATIDTAKVLDASRSMADNLRFEIAKKACLANDALMRRLNPNNESYMAIFYNDEETEYVTEITPLQLLNEAQPSGGTPTHLALDWLIKKLENRGPSIAYLITDGEPNDVDAAVKAAKEFKRHPGIMLRIFLIDGNETTEENIRKIGRAAGPQTKIVPVQNYQLNGQLITDVSQAFGQMYDLGSF